MRGTFFVFFVLLLIVGMGTQAEGALFRDAQGMPQCLVSTESKDFVLFRWGEDSYRRDVYAVKVAKNIWVNAGKRSLRVSQFQKFCKTGARGYLSKKTIEKWNSQPSADRHLIKEGEAEVFGLPLDLEVDRAFRQVRLGGNLLRSQDEESPELFFARRPLQTFDVGINRKLTARYGVGFTGALYKIYIENQSANKNFKKDVGIFIRSAFFTPKASIKKSFTEAYPNTTFVMVRGYAWAIAGERYESAQRDFRNYGGELLFLDTEHLGKLDRNAKMVAKQLDALLSQGKNLVIVGACRGVPEMLAALAMLKDKMEGPARPAQYGKVLAVVNNSGLVAGSFFTSWITAFPQWELAVKKRVKGILATKPDLPVSDEEIENIRELNLKHLQKFLKPASTSLPQSPVYLNVVGIPPVDGLAADAGMRSAQDSITRPYIGGAGANDGYIEYPGTEIPASWVRESYTMVMDASHGLVDGSFEGLSMGNDLSRPLIVSGILHAIGKRLHPD